MALKIRLRQQGRNNRRFLPPRGDRLPFTTRWKVCGSARLVQSNWKTKTRRCVD